MTSANQESTDDNTSAGASAGASAKLDTVEVLKDVITISWGDRSAWMVRDGDATVWARVVEDEYASGESKEDACLIEYNPGLHFALTPKQARELVIVLSSAIKEYDNKYGIAGDRVIDCKKN